MQQFEGRMLNRMASGQQHVGPAQPLGYLQLEQSPDEVIVSGQDRQRHILLQKAETRIGDDIQHQIFQYGLKRPYSMVSPHLSSQEPFKLQRQPSQQFHVTPNLLQQRFLRQQQMQFLAQHLRQEQHQSQHQPNQQFACAQTLPCSKQSAFESGLCARRLMQYMYHQRHRPSDNNIGFWRRFVAEYFEPTAKKRWCVSQYGRADRLPTGVFPQDVWQCEICGSKPSRGFETSVEILPRLCKIKYDSGILEDLLFVDLPHEYRLNSGVVVIEYNKAVQENVFEQLRVVREGQLRVTFSHNLKIISWEFCARSHEELLSRRSILSQVSHLAGITQRYQTSAKASGSTGIPLQDMQSTCQSFAVCSRHLAKLVEVPTVNDFGYTKRYVRCLQIAEVVNSMKSLIDYSREKGMGPIASLQNFPRISSTGVSNSASHQQDQLSLPALISEEKNTSSSEQCNDNENEDMATGPEVAASDFGSEANIPHDFTNHCDQNSISSLEMSFKNAASTSKPSAASIQDKLMQHTAIDPANYGPLRVFSASGGPESPVMSNLSTPVHQPPFNCSAKLLQRRSSESHFAQQISTNPADIFKEMMLSSEDNSPGQFEPMLVSGSTSSAGNTGQGCYVGASIDGSRPDGLQSGVDKLDNSITFSGNRLLSNTNVFGRSHGSLSKGGNLITGFGGGMRNGSGSIPMLGNTNFINSARGLPSADEHQYLQLQNSGVELHDSPSRNGLSAFASSGSFGNIQFS